MHLGTNDHSLIAARAVIDLLGRSGPTTLQEVIADSGHGRDSGQLLDGGVDSRLRELDVFQLAGEVRVIRRHVEVAVARKPEQDGPFLTCLFGSGRLLSDRPQGMGCLWSR